MQVWTLKWATGLAVALVVAFAAFGPERAAVADQGAKVAEERSKLMKGMGGAMRNIKGFVDGRSSADDAAAAADVIAASAPKIAAVFPPNTGMGANPKSEAKDNIWKEWDAFTAAAKALGDKAAAFKTALASGDKGAAAAAFGDLAKSGCGGCHRQFRQKRN